MSTLLNPAPLAGGSDRRPAVEVADIFRAFGDSYRRAHPLPLHHLRTMHAIEICRTAALGGHVKQCTTCGHQRPVYNSCRNRHWTTSAVTRIAWPSAIID